MTRSLTHDSWQMLSRIAGPDVAQHFTSTEGLIEEYLDTRLPEERPCCTSTSAAIPSSARERFYLLR